MRAAQLRGLAAGVVLAVTLLQGSPARGQDMTASRRHFERAEAHYQRGEYQQAFHAYEAAYVAAPLPDFLFNMGQCQRKLGNRQRAIELYERFLESSNDPDRRRVARQVLDEIRDRPAAAAGPRPALAAGGVADPGTTTSEGPGPAPAPEDSPDRPGPLARIRLATWLVLGGGGVLLGVGGYFGLRVLDAQDELDSIDCTSEGPRCLRIEDEADGDFTKQIVFQTLGGAALALTAVLAILDITATPPARGEAFLLPSMASGRLMLEGGARW
ncbi:MAG: tetratricopeptide repeat protein [Deltaproteobacteria bacterium]|nr:tetratricopeptide repeat protein [Deltaproteobacteria bacterium]